MSTPEALGNAPIAGTQGAVTRLQVVEWPLPTAVVAAGVVFLRLATPSSDGVNYWNLDGPEPPRLVIDLQ